MRRYSGIALLLGHVGGSWVLGFDQTEVNQGFLRALVRVANQLRAGDELIAIVCRETALPAARIQGERGRTSGQMRWLVASGACAGA